MCGVDLFRSISFQFKSPKQLRVDVISVRTTPQDVVEEAESSLPSPLTSPSMAREIMRFENTRGIEGLGDRGK